MRIVKLNPHDLNKTYTDLLMKLGARLDQRVFPGYVYLAEEDATLLRRNNRKKIRAEQKYASKASVDEQIDFLDGNYGPNEAFAKALRPGYALVDDEGISNSVALDNINRQEAQPDQLANAAAALARDEAEEVGQPLGLIARIKNYFNPDHSECCKE